MSCLMSASTCLGYGDGCDDDDSALIDAFVFLYIICVGGGDRGLVWFIGRRFAAIKKETIHPLLCCTA